MLSFFLGEFLYGILDYFLGYLGNVENMVCNLLHSTAEASLVDQSSYWLSSFYNSCRRGSKNGGEVLCQLLYGKRLPDLLMSGPRKGIEHSLSNSMVNDNLG